MHSPVFIFTSILIMTTTIDRTHFQLAIRVILTRTALACRISWKLRINCHITFYLSSSSTGDCPNSSSAKCLNGGFLKAFKNDGKDCDCECPPNTSGQFCEQIITEDYYDAIDPLPCGGNITTPQVIQTPNYPKRHQPRQSCVWDVRVSSTGSELESWVVLRFITESDISLSVCGYVFNKCARDR